MFQNLSDSLSQVFQRLKGKGYLSEDDINTAMREVRIALLEADVALPVIKTLVEQIKEKATGSEVIKSVSPVNMVIKIVQDHLTDLLGSEAEDVNLNVPVPAVLMMVGLQGSGKTTSTAKLAHRLHDKQGKKILLASLDVYRPAAQEQLAVLGKQIGVDTLPVSEPNTPLAITKRALEAGRLGGYDIVMLDTAGRLHIDPVLMEELKQVKQLASPVETLLVADALTGQDAVNIARQFHEQVAVTGIILTRIDGDGRGGAALSMRQVTGCPIKFMGVGEKISEFEPFHPERIATRILGMGDIVSLVEKAAEMAQDEDAMKLEKKLKKGQFDLNDLAGQFKMMRKMGGIGSLLGMLPGLGKMKDQIDQHGNSDKMLKRFESIIYSMTFQERKYPKVIDGSRKRRIAAGSGVEVSEVNQLLKQYKQMSLMIKKFGKMDKKQLMRGGMSGMLGGMRNTGRRK